MLVGLAISPPLGALAGFIAIRGLRRGGRRATRRWHGPVRGASWATSAALAFGHGQMGIGWVVTLPVTALLAGALTALWLALP